MCESRFAMVSGWMENGNINEFVKANPYANRFELVGSSHKVPRHPPNLPRQSDNPSSLKGLPGD